MVCHSLWERDFESSILSTPTRFALLSLMVEVLFCKQGVVVRFHPGAPSLFHSSTAVVQLTVNQLVVGSIPACGAILKENDNETC